MATDHVRYDLLVQEALRGVVRTVLTDAAKKGLPGEHHFFITFDTCAEGVRLSQRMRAQYPKEMTVVLQHQFWDLTIAEDFFEVGLSFGGVPERLAIPFASVKGFFDPSVEFGLQFEQIGAAEADTDAKGAPGEPAAKKGGAETGSERVPAKPRRAAPSAPPPANPPAAESGTPSGKPREPESERPADKSTSGEVVRLDRFRKK
jgi:hypothetical protein